MAEQKPEWHILCDRIEDACIRRDKRLLYRLFAIATGENKKQAPDFLRVRTAARCYAGETHGWEIDA